MDHAPERYLEQAIDVAVRNAAGSGGPFGAVVVAPDGRVFEGANRVTSAKDPTAHAEVVAIRTACAALDTFDLAGCTLYSSCEPCPMCLAAALWARVDAVRFAADRHAALAAGFDDVLFYEYLAGTAPEGLMQVVQVEVENPGAPFEAWAANTARIHY
ncbi:nucleoside deaminase [Cellulomonas fimi]|uniref:Nucleoside deaminase n=1 Tax=Cellulomonas fimi TaxID=1708 RepID=A0A7Y0LYV6_CELFI|nr:nucleoside deaminase [Cellulomonas fimi]NMR19933.1 nucleoside deaminase [Cellulomonas fimi]